MSGRVDTGRARDGAGRPEAAGRGARPRILVVGETDGAGLPDFGAEEGFTFAEIQDVGAELIEALRPDIVLSPMLTRSFDCIDLAQILCSVGYRGAYRVVTPALPQPALILDEIRALCPDLSFDLVLTEGLTQLC